ncbi:MAG: CinA family nicotinamide mononucleotide deamidase-related protein [Proteobacteria bacterium]|nr:CinA family nicotinamide mononucleotide deamidase-related protein [Pseudomonadota bacterium]
MGTDTGLQGEVIAIGSELLLGRIVDTNSSYLGRELAGVGITLSHITAVGDDLGPIIDALRFGLDRSDIVITTGGLGPTEDDLTRDAVAKATGQRLIFHPELMKQIEAIFKTRGFQMSPNNRKQAYIPQGALPIRNPMGTAPGFIVEDRRGVVISLPGVPRELEHLLGRTVLPYLKKKYRLGRQVILTRVLRVCGLGESGVDRQVGDLIRLNQNPSIGLLASPGDVKISIVSHGRSRKEALNMIDPIEREIRNRLGILIYGVDNETLEQKVAEYLIRLNVRLSVADAVTGGLICQRVVKTGTDRFMQGFVLPSKSAQQSFLNLTDQAFSSLVEDRVYHSTALARKIVDHANVGMGITGDFRPSHGDMRGTLTVAIAETETERFKSWEIGGPRDAIAERATIMALDMLRKYLLERLRSIK